MLVNQNEPAANLDFGRREEGPVTKGKQGRVVAALNHEQSLLVH